MVNHKILLVWLLLSTIFSCKMEVSESHPTTTVTSSAIPNQTSNTSALTSKSTTSPLKSNIPVVSAIVYNCNEMAIYDRSVSDVSRVLQSCIDRTPNNETLWLPKGKFVIIKEVRINHPVKLAAFGSLSSQCSADDNHDCTEFRASAQTLTQTGFFKVLSSDVTLDHIVINGNKSERQNSEAYKKCAADSSNNIYGMNDQFVGDNITIKNSVFKNALCGTGLYLISGKNFIVTNNIVAGNGVHDKTSLWSDGLTAIEISNSQILNNQFTDNTDVDLIFGACPNCKIQNNTIRHQNNFSTSSFAALMIQSWPGGGTTGNYAGADISFNNIDCSSGKRCGFGLLIGQSSWYEATTFGGSVHDNIIANAQQGFAADKVSAFAVYNNQVTSSGGKFYSTCGKQNYTSYGITYGTMIDRSKDQTPTKNYVELKLQGCIPNDHKHPY